MGGLIAAGGAAATTGSAGAETTDGPFASVTLEDQVSTGESVLVGSATLEVPGYVTVHEARLLEGVAAPSIVGVTGFLEAGEYENVVVPFTRIEGNPIEPDGTEKTHTLIAVPHFEASDPPNERFDFHGSPGDPDADLSDNAFTNGPKETDGLPNDGVNAVATVTFPARLTRDDIATAKYDLAFDDLSETTQIEVEELFDRQPFTGTLTAATVSTRTELAMSWWGAEVDALTASQASVLEKSYDGQFLPCR